MSLSLPSALMLLVGIGLVVFGARGLDEKHNVFGGRFATQTTPNA